MQTNGKLCSLTTTTKNTTDSDNNQVLKLERQVLKKRVKRDFLELSSGEAHQPQLGRPAASPHLLRPTAGRPAHHQLTRPANQLPSQQTTPANGQRRPNYPGNQQMAATLTTSGQQRHGPFLDQLDTAPSGPAPFFSQPGPSNLSHKQTRPLPPPLSTSGNSTQSALVGAAASNSSSGQLRRAPFDDPSWPLMWYLVSSCSCLKFGFLGFAS